MEQNLSEKERKIRLVLGSLMLLTAAGTYITNFQTPISSFMAIGGIALLLNYFTCFCGAKKAVKTLKSRFESLK